MNATVTNAQPRFNRRPSFVVGLLMSGAALGACEATPVEADGSTGAGLSGAQYDEIAAAMGSLVADQSLGQANAFAGAVALSRGDMPDDFEARGDIVFAQERGLQYNLSAVCSDHNGVGVECGDEATESHVTVGWWGDWSNDNGQVRASADFDAHWVLSDLDQQTIVLDGGASATSVIVSQPKNVQHSWKVDYKAAYDGVGIDAESGRAVAGAVRYAIQVQRRDGLTAGVEHASVAIRGELVFEEDGATLTLDTTSYRVATDGSVERQ